jgi:hypothetical protein
MKVLVGKDKIFLLTKISPYPATREILSPFFLPYEGLRKGCYQAVVYGDFIYKE